MERCSQAQDSPTEPYPMPKGETMRRHLRRMMSLTLGPMFGGAGLGATAAAIYAVLCTALYWLITGKGDALVPLLIRFVTSGAAAGAIVGLCLAIDRATRGADPWANVDTPVKEG